MQAYFFLVAWVTFVTYLGRFDLDPSDIGLGPGELIIRGALVLGAVATSIALLIMLPPVRSAVPRAVQGKLTWLGITLLAYHILYAGYASVILYILVQDWNPSGDIWLHSLVAGAAGILLSTAVFLWVLKKLDPRPDSSHQSEGGQTITPPSGPVFLTLVAVWLAALPLGGVVAGDLMGDHIADGGEIRSFLYRAVKVESYYFNVRDPFRQVDPYSDFSNQAPSRACAYGAATVERDDPLQSQCYQPAGVVCGTLLGTSSTSHIIFAVLPGPSAGNESDEFDHREFVLRLPTDEWTVRRATDGPTCPEIRVLPD